MKKIITCVLAVMLLTACGQSGEIVTSNSNLKINANARITPTNVNLSDHTAPTPLRGELVEYYPGQPNKKGYPTPNPALSSVRPGVVLKHEWWGMNTDMKKLADDYG